MKTKPILVLRKRLVWRVLAIACLVLLTGIATLAVQTTSAPKAHADGCIGDCTTPSSQLAFLDNRGDVYSIRVRGPNQYNPPQWSNSPCWQTPTYKTIFYNWWWSSTTDVYLYRNSDCTDYIGYLYFNSDGSLYRCLEDTPPYPDYDCIPN